MADTPLLLAGLGNPGDSYAHHRHNVGFMALNAIAAAHAFGPWRKRFQGLWSEGTLRKRRTYLLKPQTYMNDSGNSVSEALRFFKLPLAALVVFHDEVDLAPGKFRLKIGGGDAGHNGLRSISTALGAEYRRVRIGVGHPGVPNMVHAHVLRDFTKADREWLIPMLEAMAKSAPLLAADDDTGFMNRVALATKPPKEPKDDGV